MVLPKGVVDLRSPEGVPDGDNSMVTAGAVHESTFELPLWQGARSEVSKCDEVTKRARGRGERGAWRRV